jgi:DNA-binding transcriptional ArsR family regulator
MSATWDDEYLTVHEIADRLKLNQQTVRNWIFSTESGGLRCVDWIRGRCVDVPSRRRLRLVTQ